MSGNGYTSDELIDFFRNGLSGRRFRSLTIDEAERKHNKMQTTILYLGDKNEKLKKQCKDLIWQRSSVMQRNAALEEENSQLKTRLRSLQPQIATFKALLNRWQLQNPVQVVDDNKHDSGDQDLQTTSFETPTKDKHKEKSNSPITSITPITPNSISNSNISSITPITPITPMSQATSIPISSGDSNDTSINKLLCDDASISTVIGGGVIEDKCSEGGNAGNSMPDGIRCGTFDDSIPPVGRQVTSEKEIQDRRKDAEKEKENGDPM